MKPGPQNGTYVVLINHSMTKKLNCHIEQTSQTHLDGKLWASVQVKL